MNGKSYQDKITRKNKQHEAIFLEANYFPIFSNNARVIAVAKIAFNITERTNRINTSSSNVLDIAQLLTTLSSSGQQKITQLHENMNEVVQVAAANQKADNYICICK